MLAAVKDDMSQRDAAENLKIPRCTLRNHIKSGITKKTLGRKSVLTVEQEQDLVRRCSEAGMPITVPMIGRYVYQFLAKNNCEEHETVNQDWNKGIFSSFHLPNFRNVMKPGMRNSHFVQPVWVIAESFELETLGYYRTNDNRFWY